MKCPKCHEILDKGTSKCPYCSFELNSRFKDTTSLSGTKEVKEENISFNNSSDKSWVDKY